MRVAYDAVETTHRVVVGRRFFADAGQPPEAALDAALGFLLACRVPMRPEDGMTDVAGFNPGYFSVAEVDQSFPDFRAWLDDRGLAPQGGDGVWRFNKVHDYGDSGVAPPAYFVRNVSARASASAGLPACSRASAAIEVAGAAAGAAG